MILPNSLACVLFMQWTSMATLTQVFNAVACFVECPRVELQADDGEYDDGKEEEQSDVDQGTDSLGYGGYDDLETWGDKILRK